MMKNETNLLPPQDAYWKPKKSDTVGAKYDFNDKHKILTIVKDMKGRRLQRCKKTAEMYVYSSDTWSIEDYSKTYKWYIRDPYGNDTVEVVIAYDGVDLIWDNERKCFL